MTKTNLISLGKIPDDSDIFMMLVIGWTRTSANSFNRKIGTGSRSEDFDGQSLMRAGTSETLTREKMEKVFTGITVSGSASGPSVSRLVRIYQQSILKRSFQKHSADLVGTRAEVA